MDKSTIADVVDALLAGSGVSEDQRVGVRDIILRGPRSDALTVNVSGAARMLGIHRATFWRRYGRALRPVANTRRNKRYLVRDVEGLLA